MCTVTAANEFLELWRSGANDEAAQLKLNEILERQPLSCRIVHGMPDNPVYSDPEKATLSASWFHKRLSWVFGPEALPLFLGKTPYQLLMQLGGATREWLLAKQKQGRHFKLAVFPSESVHAQLATWDNVGQLLEMEYPEVWDKIEPTRWRITELTERSCSTGDHPLAEIQKLAGYDMEKVNLVGRDPASGESEDPRYMSLQRLQRLELNPEECNHHDQAVVKVRQFLIDEIGLSKLYTGLGYTVSQHGVHGPPEYLAQNKRLLEIDGCAVEAIDPFIDVSDSS